MYKIIKRIKFTRLLFFIVLFIFINLEQVSGENVDGTDIVYTDQTNTYIDDVIEYENNNSVYLDDMIFYSDDITTYLEQIIFYEFGELIDDIYVINYQTQDYINSHIIIGEDYTIDMAKVLSNFSIGVGSTILGAIISVSVPGGQAIIPFIISFTKKVAIKALIEGISTFITTIKQNGNFNAIIKSTIERVSEEYKWAIFDVSYESIKKIKLYTKYKNGNKIIRQLVSANLENFSEKEISSLRKFSMQEMKSVQKYTSGDHGSYYKKIQDFLLKGGNPALYKHISYIDSALKKNILKSTSKFFRGQGGSITTLISMGLKNFLDKDGHIITEKLIGQRLRNIGYTSTSKSFDVAKNFAKHSNSNEKLIREIICPKGLNALDINEYELSDFKYESEVLLPRNLTTKILDAYRDSEGFIHIIEEVIF